MYAVELFMNEEIDLAVRQIWKGLADTGITDGMYSIDDIRSITPHVTLAVYQDLPIAEFQERFAAFVQAEAGLAAKFDILGSFPTSGTVFLAPVMTQELLDLHTRFHRVFSQYAETASPYYLPGNWNPHCSLAIRLNQEEMNRTLAYCLQDFQPLQGKFVEVGIVHLEWEDGKCVSSKTVYSSRLR